MKNHIDEVITQGLQAVQQVIEPKRSHTDGPVGLVAGGTGHLSPPEVVGEDIGPGGLGKEVFILLDCGFVIEHDSAL